LEIKEGDEFGILDMSHICIIGDQKITKILKNQERIFRQFTLQALTDCDYFSINNKNI
jgi:hypothetical protein